MKPLAAVAVMLAATSAIMPAPLGALSNRQAVQSELEGKPGDQEQRATALREAVVAVDYWLDQARQYSRIPALSVALVNGQQTVWSKGYGYTDRAMRQPATADTIYSICSISKLFTAVAFMQQWEKGTVRLDEPVRTYLPWAQFAPDERDSIPVTMRGLLTHSAGLPREAVKPYWTGPDFPFPSQAEIHAGVAGQHLLYPASTTFQYSNLGLTLVGETVEKVTGTPYGEYVSTNVLAPLEMNNTRPFIPTGLYGKQLAVGWGSLEPDGTRPRVKLFDAKGINPAAGYSSTVEDLAKFARWQFRLLQSGQPELLRASTLREMHRVHYITPDRRTSWGLGFAVYQMDGRELVGHGGSCPGYRSSLLIDPSAQMAVAVAINAMDDSTVLARAVGALVAVRLATSAFEPPQSGVVDLRDYVGIYNGQPWGADFAMLPWAGGLVGIEAGSRGPFDTMDRFKPLGDDRFRVVTSSGEERDIVTFHRDASGKVTRMERFGQFTPRRSSAR